MPEAVVNLKNDSIVKGIFLLYAVDSLSTRNSSSQCDGSQLRFWKSLSVFAYSSKRTQTFPKSLSIFSSLASLSIILSLECSIHWFYCVLCTSFPIYILWAASNLSNLKWTEICEFKSNFVSTVLIKYVAVFKTFSLRHTRNCRYFHEHVVVRVQQI